MEQERLHCLLKVIRIFSSIGKCRLESIISRIDILINFGYFDNDENDSNDDEEVRYDNSYSRYYLYSPETNIDIDDKQLSLLKYYF